MSFPDRVVPVDAHIWATMIPARTPEFKVHKTEALANSAMGNRNIHESYAKYELVNGIWEKRYEYVPPAVCDSCGGPFIGTRSYDRGMNRKAHFYKGPQYLAPVICSKCYEADRAEHNRIWQEKRERETLAKLQAKYN